MESGVGRFLTFLDPYKNKSAKHTKSVCRLARIRHTLAVLAQSIPLIEMHSTGIGTKSFDRRASEAAFRSPFVQVKNFEDISQVT